MSSPLKRPIIILGAPRSGTSILSRLLSCHPDLATSIEPRLVWRRGNNKRSDALRPEHATPAIKQSIRGFFSNKVTTLNKKRLLEKTPSNSLRPEFVDAIFPDAIYLHSIRNGFDATLSIESYTSQHATSLPTHRLKQRLQEMQIRQIPFYAAEMAQRALPKFVTQWMPPPAWGPRIPGLSALSRELHPSEVAACQWRWCVEKTVTFGNTVAPERFFQFHLEHFTQDTLATIMDFAGLSQANEVFDHYEQNYVKGKSTARSNVSSAEAKSLIRPWIEPTMNWIGYKIDAQNNATAPPANTHP